MVHRLMPIALFGLLILSGHGAVFGEPGKAASMTSYPDLAKANRFLAAGDYRRALEACQREIGEAPSAASYIHLTYVYQAIDA